jgi:Cys-tRNA(Pro) deacylase
MHGDRQVSTRELARQIGARSVSPCEPRTAERHTGYRVGGTSPFGLRHAMPVFCESSILDLPRVYINGGKRGFIISLDTAQMLRLLQPGLVTVARA